MDGPFLCLNVPGLAKRKEEVMVGDKLIFSNPGRGGCRNLVRGGSDMNN